MSDLLRKLDTLPPWDAKPKNLAGDWLVDGKKRSAKAYKSSRKGEIILTNGLLTRAFLVVPNGATIDLVNETRGESLIRGIKPEALVTINGKQHFIGGLVGQVEYAYFLPEWLNALKSDESRFRLADFAINKIQERFPWKRCRQISSATVTNWPPKGIEARFMYRSTSMPGIDVIVHHEVYDDIPVICKWLTIANASKNEVVIDTFTSEMLATVEASSVPQGNVAKASAISHMHVESDYIFGAMSPAVSDVTTRWSVDPQYTSQVSYTSDSLVLLESLPPAGPGIVVAPGDRFETFRTWILVFDSTERERRGLAQRRMYRVIAPWVAENPVFMHVIPADPAIVKNVIDQCVNVGFEMVILSFGSGFPDIEAWIDEPDFIAEFKEMFDYAHAKGIEIGVYSLFSSRNISLTENVVSPPGKSPTFGNAPCLGSVWGVKYIAAIKTFFEKTGADFLENDGPYPGDWCASTSHPGHRGLADSQWRQWQAQAGLYTWFKSKGVYVNQPDWYFLTGGNKTGMGYKEVNWSLPRERQVIIGRQNIFDGTWEKAPSMGWMFTPLTVYHAVGGHWKESTLEPLSEHIDLFEAHLAQNFLSGVQSCYRGNRLYDSEKARAVVKKWVDVYKKHRAILDSDIIHVRRPDGRHVDGILHVNPKLEEKGLAAFYNPLNEPISCEIKLPLYYTGLTDVALVSEQDNPAKEYAIDRDHSISLPLSVQARGRTWFVIK
nr:alpha-galactosidase [Candidatus Sigynarchaeota archaeon]